VRDVSKTCLVKAADLGVVCQAMLSALHGGKSLTEGMHLLYGLFGLLGYPTLCLLLLCGLLDASVGSFESSIAKMCRCSSRR
jgi:hypothetical protein